MKIGTFLLKNGETPERVVDFLLERDTFRNKIMKIVKDFDEKKSYNNGKQTLEIVEDFACEAKFLPFFHCSSFFVISFSSLHFSSCFFILFHFLSFSDILFHVL